MKYYLLSRILMNRAENHQKKMLPAKVVDYGVSTHIGGRSQNQDDLFIAPEIAFSKGRGFVFAVADGMGGHPGGEVASRLACERLKAYFEKPKKFQSKFGAPDIRRQLAEIFIRIDRRIRLRGSKEKEYEDMGTTLSCLVLTHSRSIIGHVGDSRIYRLRKGRLTCLTVDHTFVRDMMFEGAIDSRQAGRHPLRHMLTRAVGTGEALALVDTRIDLVQKKDRFLLCTDGLYNTLPDQRISLLLSKELTAGKIAEQLIHAALENGVRDNVTVIVINMDPRSAAS